MPDDSTVHDRPSSLHTGDMSASRDVDSSGDDHGDPELMEQMQVCARELVHLLHRMPVASRKKQTAIRLLVKVIRLVTPGEPHLATPDALRPAPVGENSGAVYSKTPRAKTSERSEGASEAADARPNQSDSASRRPSPTYRQVVGL
jgi:hypothetical protein